MSAMFTALALLFALEAPPAVTLVLCDIPGALRGGGSALRGEVSALLAGSGLVIRWREVAPGHSFENSGAEIPVILLPSDMRNQGGDRVLGQVIGNHRFPSPIWISVSNVRWVVGNQGNDANTRRGAIERALGRVIAHEVVHAFVPEHRHAALGLMGRQVNRRVLTGEAGGLDRDSLSAVARALRSPELRSQMGGPPLVTLTGAQ